MAEFKKIVAREWLYFFGSFIFGLLILPVIFSLFGDDNYLNDFYGSLFDENDWIYVLIFSLIPYIILQIIRSLIWSIKTLKKRSEDNNE